MSLSTGPDSSSVLSLFSATAAFAQREQVVYNLAGVENLGATNLVTDAAGNLYGAAFYTQTVYQVSPPANGSMSWTYTAIAQAPGSPTSLAIDKNGNLFGTTLNGGVNGQYCSQGCGTVFELSPPAQSGGSWILTTIWEFQHGEPGDILPNPTGLTLGPDGVLFGAEVHGGNAKADGAVFRLRPPSQSGGSWTYNVLYQFKGGADGQSPNGAFAIDSHLNLYGTTLIGGPFNSACNLGCGTAFELSPGTSGQQWTKTTLFDFSDLGQPNGGLIRDQNGNLYGTNYASFGNVFELSPPTQSGQPWTETVLHSFTGPDGSGPIGLTPGPAGLFYGATWYGGSRNGGTVFQLKPPAQLGGSWTESVVYNFPASGSAPQGSMPDTNLLFLSRKIYGETGYGGTAECAGAPGCGVVYEIRP